MRIQFYFPLVYFLPSNFKIVKLVIIATRLFLASILLLPIALHAQGETHVGDISFDVKSDNPKFQFCNANFVLEGYILKTKADEETKWISDQLKQKFIYQSVWKNETGFVTVRFAVNCLGLTDRFRVSGVTSNLLALDFPLEITQHLLKLVKEMKWPVKSYRQQAVDYYQDVTFKIVNGEAKEVIL